MAEAQNNKDSEKGDLPMKNSNGEGGEEEEVEVKESFCNKQRLFRALIFLVVGIANKVIALRMIKKGAHKPDSCPAADEIPQFLLGEGNSASYFFLEAIPLYFWIAAASQHRQRPFETGKSHSTFVHE